MACDSSDSISLLDLVESILMGSARGGSNPPLINGHSCVFLMFFGACSDRGLSEFHLILDLSRDFSGYARSHISIHLDLFTCIYAWMSGDDRFCSS